MNIDINSHSSLFEINNKIRNNILFYINYILDLEEKTGNRKFKKFLKNGNKKDIQISFLFVDDKEIKQYNKQYFNRQTSTDVIAFSMIEGEMIKNNCVLGDAVISVETAKYNSGIYSHSFKEELLLLIIHAVLHLTGYDHPSEHSIMRKKERKYFKYFSFNKPL